jgi:hypothetical protein
VSWRLRRPGTWTAARLRRAHGGHRQVQARNNHMKSHHITSHQGGTPRALLPAHRPITHTAARHCPPGCTPLSPPAHHGSCVPTTRAAPRRPHRQQAPRSPSMLCVLMRVLNWATRAASPSGLASCSLRARHRRAGSRGLGAGMAQARVAVAARTAPGRAPLSPREWRHMGHVLARHMGHVLLTPCKCGLCQCHSQPRQPRRRGRACELLVLARARARARQRKGCDTGSEWNPTQL